MLFLFFHLFFIYPNLGNTHPALGYHQIQTCATSVIIEFNATSVCRMLIASLLFIENHCNFLLINKEIIINKSMWLDHICPNEHMCALSRHPLMFIALVLSVFSLSTCDHLDCCYHFIQPLFAIVICAYHILDLQYCY